MNKNLCLEVELDLAKMNEHVERVLKAREEYIAAVRSLEESWPDKSCLKVIIKEK